MPNIYLVSGFMRTGKDELYRMFNKVSDIEWNWVVYTRTDLSSPLIIRSCDRVSFADSLKEYVHQKLNIPPDTDVAAIKDIEYRDGKTLRDYYIEAALEKRIEDNDYWCKLAFEDYDPNKDYMVTDWRYKNESTYVESIKEDNRVVKIRLFRSEVPIPTTPSECSLNDHAVDFVLIPKDGEDEEWVKLVETFPQFTHYVKTGVIHI